MRTFLEQLERVKRSLAKIENQDRGQTEYEDDLWHFFQDCYHLKDWIKNDKNISATIRNCIEGFIKNNKELRICADLANRSKHAELTRHNREDAEITRQNYTVYPASAVLRSTADRSDICQVPSDVEPIKSTREYIITLRDGSECKALVVVREAVKAWESFLLKNNLI
jgi:sugar-specific transcriptional regulator TrmB